MSTISGTLHTESWLREAREDWYACATGGFMGCVSAGLDEHLAHDPAREATFLSLLDDLRDRIAIYDPAIPVDVVNSFGTGGPGSTYLRDVDTGTLHRFTDAVAGLVQGRIAWDTSGRVHGVWN